MPAISAAIRNLPSGRLVALGRSLLVAAGIAYILLLSLAALRSSLGLVRLPIALTKLDHHLPVIFRLHMAASGLALGSGVLTLLSRNAPHRHRPLGRLTAALVVIGGVTALPSAILSESTIAARAGFVAQGCVWIAFLVAGLAAIGIRDIARHRRAMLSMYAVASGAIWLRLGTAAIAVSGLPFDTSYAVAAWLGWLLPLGVVRIAARR